MALGNGVLLMQRVMLDTTYVYGRMPEQYASIKQPVESTESKAMITNAYGGVQTGIPALAGVRLVPSTVVAATSNVEPDPWLAVTVTGP